MDKILQLLDKDCRLTAAELASKTGRDPDEITQTIRKLENDGVILGYKALIDWDKTDREYVSAVIELKIAPQRDRGFDKIAEKIINYPEVQSVHLMSGGYDLLVVIEGKTMREVSNFVFNRLATMDGVVSTATHFILRKYKDKGVIYKSDEEDKRGNIL